MPVTAQRYPWFEIVEGDDLAQGDIFDGLRSFSVEPSAMARGDAATVTWVERDSILMTQSCDLAPNQKTIRETLLCVVWKRTDIPDFQRDDVMEAIRCGRQYRYHPLAACEDPQLNRGIRIVDFSRVTVYPIEILRGLASTMGPRLRLLPPYREHLSQAFARFFMRVGLPSEIPSFRKK